MRKVTKLKYYIESLCIYDFEEDDVFSALYDLLCDEDEDTVALQSYFFKELAKSSESLKEHISKLILTNDNIFTKAACADKAGELSLAVMNAVKSDLAKLEEIASINAQDIANGVDDDDVKEILLTLPGWEVGKPVEPLKDHWDKQIDELVNYHKTYGYGMYAKNIAFTWRDEEITPVNSIDAIRLTDLKNYELQRNKVIDNTESFIAGHPANNVLLYGDRGTGKSSTVHAILNEYWQQGLRMIEIPKSAVADLSLIREQIADSPMKFIIYIDDLSFDSNDTSFSELKAALEGSLSGKQPNTIIYATSNRRHLIKENFSDRENDVNRGDTMQEQLSLSDRFGLTITFLNPDKKEYLDIVEKLATDRHFADHGVDMDKLLFKADQWATRRGGRSPRGAKQFIDHVEGCIKRNKEW
ncbi:MAG: ATP-binding protein [Eubacteriales bacterium]|nr:ATP-binding protein [Eubacteriales bacterium]